MSTKKRKDRTTHTAPTRHKRSSADRNDGKRQVWLRLPKPWLESGGLIRTEAARHDRKVAGELAVLVREALMARGVLEDEDEAVRQNAA